MILCQEFIWETRWSWKKVITQNKFFSFIHSDFVIISDFANEGFHQKWNKKNNLSNFGSKVKQQLCSKKMVP
jgi:hypothetical protein